MHVILQYRKEQEGILGSLSYPHDLGSDFTGEAYMRLNNLEEAGHWYRESLKAKPDHIPAHLTYGKLLSIVVSQADKYITFIIFFFLQFFSQNVIVFLIN